MRLRATLLGLATLLAAALAAGPVRAQASAYVPLDDPDLPLLEHLVARGDVADPSPLVRPFRRADAVRVLHEATAAGSDTRADTATIRRLLERWSDVADAGADSRPRWRADARLGGQAYTQARRDPLHTGGDDGVRSYGELALDLTVKDLVLASRVVNEPRLQDDPDWTGVRRDDPNPVCCSWRYPDAYVSAQLGAVRLLYGQLDRNWGPEVLPGIGVSAVGYARPQVSFELWLRDLQLQSFAEQLESGRDSLGQTVQRYFFAHRLAARPIAGLSVALWETVVVAGVDRDFDGRYRNPVLLALLGNTYGFSDRGNVLVGAEAQWRTAHGLTLEGQLAIDDLGERSGPNADPDRYAFTLAANGPLGRRAAWRALYTQASSLAFRTLNPFENFTDAGVGLGRNFADSDQLTLLASVMVRPGWLLAPELTLLRQGEGRIDDPYPTAAELPGVPALFIGTVERTWRAALGVDGRAGPLRLAASAGYHHVVNADHVAGRIDDRFVGRVQVTVGYDFGGTLQ